MTGSFNISRRKSIRWLPHEPSEPTHTIVMGSGGYFIDVRFNKAVHTQELSLDWASAGKKVPGTSGPNSTRYVHLIDSRTENPSEVVDEGISTVLPNGDVLETGSMVNPATGIMTPFEELWTDEEVSEGILVSTEDHTQWRGRAGRYQVAIGRNGSKFWAWFAMDDTVLWYSGLQQTDIQFLGSVVDSWKQGERYEWDNTSWYVHVTTISH